MQQFETGDWLSLSEGAYAVRLNVFVQEQGVPVELEQDAFDALSWHVLVRSAGGGEAIATGRLLPDGHIGRLAVLAGWRGQGIGREIMRRLIATAQARGDEQVLLHAQCSAVGFYKDLGFRAEGDVFMEAGIAHQAMHLAQR